MSEDDNRAVSNLIVLCVEHASEIDDPDRVAMFPVSLLNEWKRRQLEDFDSLGYGGWNLSDAEVEKVVTYSFDTNISVQDSVLSLGGEGGQAPGAGGGGGGAMGSGATGGAGGPGGNIHLEGVTLENFPRGTFGAGGGGAGAVGEGAIGGEGGGGGDLVGKLFNANELPDQVIVTVGRPGRPVPGGDGEDGEDSSFGDFLIARGGKGGKAGRMGKLPSRVGEGQEIRVTSAFFANAAEVRDGLVYVLGGGWDIYKLPAIPGAVAGVVVCLFDVDQADVRTTFDLLFEFVSPSGEVNVSTVTPVEVENTTQAVRIAQLITFQADIEITGSWHARVSVAGHELVRLPLDVKTGD